MDRYFGFDLGDAESAIARLEEKDKKAPEIIRIKDAQSFITAYARLVDGELLIGESACYNTNAGHRSVRFKSRFLTDPETVEKAALKETSLYELALKCGIKDGTDFVRHFIEYERQNMRNGGEIHD